MSDRLESYSPVLDRDLEDLSLQDLGDLTFEGLTVEPALEVITRAMAYAANSAWQQLVVLTHNLLTNFQIETGAHRRRRSRKHTALPLLQTVQTLRFTLFLPGHSFIAPRHWYAPGAGQYCDSRATPPRSAWSPASNRVCRAPHEFFVRSRFS